MRGNLIRAFPFTTAVPSFKVGLLRYKKVRRQVAALFSVQLFAPQKSEPCRAAIPYVEDKRLAAGVQVFFYLRQYHNWKKQKFDVS